MTEETESVRVLREAIDLQISKGGDYQAAESEIRQADMYPRGIDTLNDMVWQKVLRSRSVTDKVRLGGGTNFESLEDTYLDLICYASFAVAYLRGLMDGQDSNRDAFNREVAVTPEVDSSPPF